MDETQTVMTTTWRLPDAPLRASVVSTQLAALLCAPAVAAVARVVLPLGPAYPAKVAAAIAVIALVSLGFLTAHHPFARFGAANQITTLRAVVVALVAAAIGEPRVPVVAAAAAGAALLVTSLDGLDGWLARRHRMASHFGARFDMETDALLILVLAVLAWQFGKAGTWVILSGTLRYVFVAAGAVLPWMRRPLRPSRRRQTVCVVQIAGLIVVLLPAVTQPLSAAVAATSLAALLCSFAVDTVWLCRRAA